jgi:hypothetical protein
VTAASLAEVDEKSGDLISEPGMFELLFDDGSGSGSSIGVVSMAAAVGGVRVVLEPFPSEV